MKRPPGGGLFVFLYGLLRRWRQLVELPWGGGGLRFRSLLGQDQIVAPRRNALNLRVHRACSGWDQAADDNVLLQALKRVDLSIDGCLSEDASGLLEGRGRDERACLERRFGDAEQHRHTGSGLLALARQA